MAKLTKLIFVVRIEAPKERCVCCDAPIEWDLETLTESEPLENTLEIATEATTSAEKKGQEYTCPKCVGLH